MDYVPDTTKDLWKFIKGGKKIPIRMKKFIEKYSFQNTEGEFSIGRESSKQWDLWRKQIKDQWLLSTIEQNCETNMKELGYFKLHNISQVRQVNKYPSVTDSCSQLPCL